MSISDWVVVGFVVSMFASFIIVLGGVAWWSEQTPKAARVRALQPIGATHARTANPERKLAA